MNDLFIPQKEQHNNIRHTSHLKTVCEYSTSWARKYFIPECQNLRALPRKTESN